jgi:DNA-binding response OmpR family regulator
MKTDPTFNFRDALVVMIDQSVGFMDVMAQILLAFGFKTFHRFDTVESFQAEHAQLAPDLVLIDPFPDRGGAMALIEEIRRREARSLGAMLVIVVTSRPSRDVVKIARDSGADYVVAKPFSPKVLLDRILWSAAPAERALALVEAGLK